MLNAILSGDIRKGYRLHVVFLVQDVLEQRFGETRVTGVLGQVQTGDVDERAVRLGSHGRSAETYVATRRRGTRARSFRGASRLERRLQGLAAFCEGGLRRGPDHPAHRTAGVCPRSKKDKVAYTIEYTQLHKSQQYSR